jgi:hypothetical protein
VSLAQNSSPVEERMAIGEELPVMLHAEHDRTEADLREFWARLGRCPPPDRR